MVREAICSMRAPKQQNYVHTNYIYVYSAANPVCYNSIHTLIFTNKTHARDK